MLRADLDVTEVVAAVKRTHENLERNLPMALALAGDLIAAEAKQNHDYIDRSGSLTNSIEPDEVTGSFSGRNLSITVGAGAPHAGPIEFGSKPHVIRPRFRKRLRFPGKSGFVFATEVDHPGNRAYRFLSNALFAKFAQISEIMVDATTLSFAQAGFRVE